MGLLSYIFKSKEQREKEKQEAEEARNLALLREADWAYNAKDYDACLKASMELVNKSYFGFGFWSPYLYAAEILLRKERYEEVLALKRHYHYFADKDNDRHFDWYISRAEQVIKEREYRKKHPARNQQPKPQTAQGAARQTQAHTEEEKPKPASVYEPVVKTVVKPVAKPTPQPVEPEPPKKEVHVPKWDDDELEETDDMKTSVPPLRPFGNMAKTDTLYWRYLQAQKALPSYDMLETATNPPEDAVAALEKVKTEAQKLLGRADACMRQQDWHGAANLYGSLLRHKYWEPAPYLALIEIYERMGRHEDAQAVRREGVYNLNRVQRHMSVQLLEAARKIDAEDLARDIMEKGEKVVYGLGLYTVYDPFPCIAEWEQELMADEQ